MEIIIILSFYRSQHGAVILHCLLLDVATNSGHLSQSEPYLYDRACLDASCRPCTSPPVLDNKKQNRDSTKRQRDEDDTTSVQTLIEDIFALDQRETLQISDASKKMNTAYSEQLLCESTTSCSEDSLLPLCTPATMFRSSCNTDSINQQSEQSQKKMYLLENFGKEKSLISNSDEARFKAKHNSPKSEQHTVANTKTCTCSHDISEFVCDRACLLENEQNLDGNSSICTKHSSAQLNMATSSLSGNNGVNIGMDADNCPQLKNNLSEYDKSVDNRAQYTRQLHDTFHEQERQQRKQQQHAQNSEKESCNQLSMRQMSGTLEDNSIYFTLPGVVSSGYSPRKATDTKFERDPHSITSLSKCNLECSEKVIQDQSACSSSLPMNQEDVNHTETTRWFLEVTEEISPQNPFPHHCQSVKYNDEVELHPIPNKRQNGEVCCNTCHSKTSQIANTIYTTSLGEGAGNVLSNKVAPTDELLGSLAGYENEISYKCSLRASPAESSLGYKNSNNSSEDRISQPKNITHTTLSRESGVPANSMQMQSYSKKASIAKDKHFSKSQKYMYVLGGKTSEHSKKECMEIWRLAITVNNPSSQETLM